MLHTDIPTEQEFRGLDAIRGGICVSIYRPTTPVTREAKRDRILFKHLVTDAINQLKEGGGRKGPGQRRCRHHRARRILDEPVGLTVRAGGEVLPFKSAAYPTQAQSERSFDIVHRIRACCAVRRARTADDTHRKNTSWACSA
jgi:hypothetical protein